MTQPNSPDQNRIDDLEQTPIDEAEAENVKGGTTAAKAPSLIRVPGPTVRKAEPCWVEPCF